jgi:excisionase family DNA binding protein
MTMARRTPSPDQLLLTPEEAASILRIGRTMIYALIRDEALRAVRIGRSRRISRAELERYVTQLDAGQQPKQSPPPDVLKLRSHNSRRAESDGPDLFGDSSPFGVA